MGLYGIMNTSVSGMNAQANKLSTVADNISNSDTAGYKRYNTSFSSLVGSSGSSGHESGIVNTSVVQTVREQGAFNFTSTGTNLAINGNGFFQVQDSQGATYYSRAGDFVLNKNGELVNAGGYKLLSGAGGAVQIDMNTPVWQQSTSGELGVNLPSSTAKRTGTIDETNYDFKTSVSGFDQNGNLKKVNVIFAKTDETVSAAGKVVDSKWTVMMLDESGTAVPASALELEFDGSGKLKSGTATDFTFDFPNGGPVTLDMSKTVTAGDKFSVNKIDVDGYAPSNIKDVRIESDGRIFGIYDSGAEKMLDQLQIANFSNPNGLQVKSGNVYAATNASGDPAIGYPGDNGFGELFSGAVEGSNVDLATELTEMVQAQRTYSANTKVFNASSELLQELNNLR